MWLLLVLVVLAGSPPEHLVDLQWSAPAACPDADAVHARIAAMTDPGYRVEGRVEAEVSRRGEGWHLALRLRFPEGEARRELDGASCDAVADAAALIVAVMLDPESVLEEIEQSPATPLESVEPTEPDPVPDSTPTPPVWAIIGMTANGSFASLPRLGFNIVGWAGVGGRRYRAEVLATYDLSQTTVDERGAGASADVWTLGARGCGVPGPLNLQVPLCAGIELGQVRARGVGLQAPRSSTAFHAQATLGAALVYFPIRYVGVRVGADLLLNIRPWQIVIDDLGDVHESRTAGVRFGAGVETRFP